VIDWLKVCLIQLTVSSESGFALSRSRRCLV
jgi:hypothetical protein